MAIAAARRCAALLAIAVLAMTPAVAQETRAGSGLPAVLDPGAPDGAELTAREDRPFDRYLLPVGPYARDSREARALEGRVIRSAWRLADAQATTAGVMAGYRERLAGLGYDPVFACTTEACGGIDFRFAVELMPAPAMLLDAADFAQLSARRAGEGRRWGESYVSILVSRLLGAVYIQTVAVAPAEADTAIAPAPAAASGAAPPPDPLTAAGAPASGAETALLERLDEYGHVRLEGLAFESGSAGLMPDSEAALDLAARALAARPQISVLIVGHSDDRGALEDNIALSRRRAQAVREALVARGIDAARLEAHGVGFLAPVAENATEAGRALNRRVELVLR